MDVKYIGRANRRIIRTSDMQAQGIEGFETTTWEKGGTETVLDAAGEWLTTHLSVEFVKVEPAPAQTLSSKKSSSSSSSTAETASSSK